MSSIEGFSQSVRALIFLIDSLRMNSLTSFRCTRPLEKEDTPGSHVALYGDTGSGMDPTTTTDVNAQPKPGTTFVSTIEGRPGRSYRYACNNFTRIGGIDDDRVAAAMNPRRGQNDAHVGCNLPAHAYGRCGGSHVQHNADYRRRAYVNGTIDGRLRAH